HLVHGVEELLAEGGVCDAAVVARLVHEAPVDPDAGALQKVLRDCCLEARLQRGTVDIGRIGAGHAAVVESHLQRTAGYKTLVVGKVVLVGVRRHLGEPAREEGVDLGLGGALQLDGSSYGRIQVLRVRPRARGGESETVDTRTRATGAHGGSSRTAASRQRRGGTAQRSSY